MMPTYIQELMTSPSFELIGWTLLHSLWQIALIGLVFWGVRASIQRIRPKRANWVYSFGCLCLTAMVGAPLLTLYFVTPADLAPFHPLEETSNEFSTLFGDKPASEFDWGNTSQVSVASNSELALLTPAKSAEIPKETTANWSRFLPPVSFLTLFWLAGIAVFSIRPVLGIWNVRRLSRSRIELPAPVQNIVRQVIQQLNLSKSIEFAGSRLAQVPTVIGYFQPIVLIPAASVSGLTPLQIKQILTHEIAHIQRHDYLVNFIQTLLETLLFYHPVAWWVSNQVRMERENCCDDVAISEFGDSKSFVQALVTMEQTRSTAAPPALASHGGSLITRVRRLLDQPTPTTGRPGRSTAACLSAVLLVGIATTLSLASQPNEGDGTGQNEPGTIRTSENTSHLKSFSNAILDVLEDDQHSGNDDDQVVAIVNGQQILRSTVEERCYQHVGKRVLESMIKTHLIEDACRANGIVISDESIDAYAERKAKRYGITMDKFFEVATKNQAITIAQMRERLKLEIALETIGFEAARELDPRNLAKSQPLPQLLSELRRESDVQVFDFKEFNYGDFEPEDTIAIVNGREIRKRLVMQKAFENHARTLLKAEIERTVLRQALSQAGLRVTDQDIRQGCLDAAKSQLSASKQNGLDDESLIDRWLTDIKQRYDRSTQASIRTTVWPMVALKKLVNQDGPDSISDDELEKAFAANYGPRAEVLAIVADDQKTAIKCWNLARANPTKSYFAELARQYSVEPVTKKHGGECPPIARRGSRPELEKAAFELKQGEISNVINEVSGKWIILFRLGLTKQKETPDSVRDKLIEHVWESKRQKAMFFKLQELLGAADTQQFRLANANPLQDPVPVQSKKEDVKIVTTYSIADLITPIPFMSYEEMDEEEKEVDPTKLIELIKKTVAPDYWENGEGNIDFFQANASLIVHAKRSIHDQIQDLLPRLQELNAVTLELRGFIVVMPQRTFAEHAKRIPEKTGTITYRDAILFFGLAKSNEDSTAYEIPVIDLFNGQSKKKGIADIDLGIDATLTIQQAISMDRKSVQTFVTAKDRNAEAPTGIVVPETKHAEYVAVDIKGLLPEAISDSHKAVMVFRVSIFDNGIAK